MLWSRRADGFRTCTMQAMIPWVENTVGVEFRRCACGELPSEDIIDERDVSRENKLLQVSSKCIK